MFCQMHNSIPWLIICRYTSSADVRVRAIALAAISLTNVSVGALLYKMATGDPWSSSFFTVYSILFNVPGTDLTEERFV